MSLRLSFALAACMVASLSAGGPAAAQTGAGETQLRPLVPAQPGYTANTPSTGTPSPGVSSAGMAAAPSAEVATPDPVVPGLRWVSASNGAIPPGAMEMGRRDGRPVYACLASMEGPRVGAVAPGGSCDVAVEGTAVGVYDYQVLTGAPWLLRWDQNGDVLSDGYAPGGAGPLCVVDYIGGIVPGMAMNDGHCHIPYGNTVLQAEDFRTAAPNPSGAFSLRWAKGGWVPPGAVTAGLASMPGDGPVVCLAEEQGRWIPGQINGEACVTGTRAGVVRAPGYTTVIGDPARVVWVPYRSGGVYRYAGNLEEMTKIGGFQGAGAPPIPVCRVDSTQGVLLGHEEAASCIVVTPGGQLAAADDYAVLHYRREGPQMAVTPR